MLQFRVFFLCMNKIEDDVKGPSKDQRKEEAEPC
jgi:hypothetical protein